MVGLTIQVNDKLALPVVNLHINTSICGDNNVFVGNLVCNNGKSVINMGLHESDHLI